MKPLALTMGDPAGIGPEIAVKALTGMAANIPVIVVGNAAVMSKAVDLLGAKTKLRQIESPDQWQSGALNVLEVPSPSLDAIPIGEASAAAGRSSYDFILKGIDLAKASEVAGVVTNPINKKALKLAGINYPGHTEIFAHETGVKDFTMMFLLENVAVVHVTTHCSLRQALESITKERVLLNIHLLNAALKKMGIADPRIAVGGLNPHAGESGLFGTEEIEHIVPAVEQAAGEGINIYGPHPPDTVFMRSFKGEFDGVVSMLHDHGFVALKSRDFESGVNITIGLPIVRTSVGHGTAFEIAGKGVASENSLLAAIRAAGRLVRDW